MIEQLHNWVQRNAPDEVTSELRLHPAAKYGPLVVSQGGEKQVIARSSKGRISVICGEASFGMIEIYCLDGRLFDDIERYNSVSKAGQALISYLT